MSALSLPALRAVQNGHVMFLVSIPAATLNKLTLKVERFDSTLIERLKNNEIDKEEYLAEQGYQRIVDNNRANKFAAYLQQQDAISPTVLLINDRDGSCEYNEKTGKLTFDVTTPLYIYDGQHRHKGIEKALLSKADLSEFPIFAVITSQLRKIKEMTQFKVINGTAKGVKTNLVIEIMTAIQTDETEVSVKDVKQITCSHATHEINARDDSPWKGMVALANTGRPKRSEINENPELEFKRIIGSQSFLRSLQSVHDYLESNKWPTVPNGMLKNPASLEVRGKKIADIAIEFWQAVQQLMPEVFEEPNKYMLNSFIGLNAMHNVLASLMGDMYKGRREWEVDEFVAMIRHCEWFTDASNWEKNDGEASNYGGYGGIERLSAEIIASLVPNSAVA